MITFTDADKVIIELNTNIPPTTFSTTVYPSSNDPKGTAMRLANFLQGMAAGAWPDGVSGTLYVGSGTVSTGPGNTSYALDLT